MYTDDLFESVYDMECIEYAYESAMLEEFLDDENSGKALEASIFASKKTQETWFQKIKRKLSEFVKRVIDWITGTVRKIKNFFTGSKLKSTEKKLKSAESGNSGGQTIVVQSRSNTVDNAASMAKGAAMILVPAAVFGYFMNRKMHKYQADYEESIQENAKLKGQLDSISAEYSRVSAANSGVLDRYKKSKAEVAKLKEKLSDALEKADQSDSDRAAYKNATDQYRKSASTAINAGKKAANALTDLTKSGHKFVPVKDVLKIANMLAAETKQAGNLGNSIPNIHKKVSNGDNSPGMAQKLMRAGSETLSAITDSLSSDVSLFTKMADTGISLMKK